MARIWLDDCFGELMANVWRDFPRQKFSNGLLLNYLCLSKRPRYRQFFTDVNKQLLKRTFKIVFGKLKEVTQKQRKFKVNLVVKQLHQTFRKFAEQCQRECYLRQVSQHLAHKKRTSDCFKVVSVLKQHKGFMQDVKSKQQQL